MSKTIEHLTIKLHRHRPIQAVRGDPYNDLRALLDDSGKVQRIANSDWFDPWQDLATTLQRIQVRLERSPAPEYAVRDLGLVLEHLAILSCGMRQWSKDLLWMRRELLRTLTNRRA